LREEVEARDQQLIAKDMEMEAYKKAGEERILELEARVKELERKGEGASTVTM